ncbi:hypothetical protein [Vibrio superstes]|uniref:Uncharacterized protein n=1 Tax=Vibrio superstes NBRC 103154 TaxID=1219062 RepID=A0A511QQJ0_9VIBR|nr:hypothetical protein [Vibrio superstes]GEM79337.1 hypothetical protein VSU01S_15820 [Vibrio superstes NBRC 103154]
MKKKLMLVAILTLLAGTATASECRTSTVKRVAVWTVTLPVPLNTVWTWLYFTGEDLYCYAVEEENQSHIIELNQEYIKTLGYMDK